MAVKEAQRKAAQALTDAQAKAEEGLAKARESVAGGLQTARHGAEAARGRATPRLRTAGKAANLRLQAAQAKAGKGLEAGRLKAGRTLGRTRRKVGYWVAGEKPKSRARRIGAGILTGAVGAAAAFFFDPVSGKRRRRLAKDWTIARFRGLASRGTAAGRFAAARASGTVQGIRHRREERVPENDQVLAHKVESELFQDIDIPSGQIVINAEQGVVVLRGQVDRPDDIRRLEDRVRRIGGVREVENLLHLPGQPAPTSR